MQRSSRPSRYRFENLKLLGEVRQSEAGYRNLFNSINDAIYILDENGRLLDVNKGAETMYGYERAAMLGKTPDMLAAPGLSVLADVAVAMRKALKGEPQLIEFSGIRSDGTTFPQEVRFVPATYGGNRVVIAVARDISERKRVEAERLRTQKIEAIGVLAGGIAHDFNNLLQAVFGFLTVAKRKVDQRDRVLLMLEKAEKALHDVGEPDDPAPDLFEGRQTREEIDRPWSRDRERDAVRPERVTFGLPVRHQQRALAR